jgi:hypothetical protein
MPEENGHRTAERLADLEEMDKLLLRAQVLQQRALEILQQTVSRQDAAIASHDQWFEDFEERHARWMADHEARIADHEARMAESEALWRRIDTGLAEATEKINFLIDREMRREGGLESR